MRDAPFFTQDHRQLGFVIEGVIGVERAVNPIIRAAYGRTWLAENYRVGRYVARGGAGVIATVTELVRMRIIVLADAEDISAGRGDGRQQTNVPERDTSLIRPSLHIFSELS